MKSRSSSSGAQRYDDMIGYLVAFEKKVETIDVCCNLQTEAINSNGSSSSSAPASYIRYAGSIKRSHRGRLRDPVPKRSEEPPLRNNIESLISTEEDHRCSHHKGNKGSDHMIIAVSDVVEVIMKCNETEDQANLGSTSSQLSETDVMHSPSTFPIDKHVKQASYCSTSDDNPEIQTGSSLSSILIVEPELLLTGKGEREEKRLPVSELFSTGFNSFVDSQKSSETSILRPSSILKEQQLFYSVEKEGFRETKFNNSKVIGVMFRDPIFEVIPTKQGSIESDSCEYNVGDHVEIADRMHRRKIGRIVKTLGDIVQIEVGNVKPMYLYLSPHMLQPLNGCQILI